MSKSNSVGKYFVSNVGRVFWLTAIRGGSTELIVSSSLNLAILTGRLPSLCGKGAPERSTLGGSDASTKLAGYDVRRDEGGLGCFSAAKEVRSVIVVVMDGD